MADHLNLQSSPRKRRRPALSCEQCRRRKVRCDRNMPCGPCKKVYGSMDCSYVYEGKAALKARRETSKTNDNDARPGPEHLQEATDVHIGGADDGRIAQMESTIRALQDRVHCLENSAPGSSSRPETADESSPQENTCVDVPRLASRDGEAAGNGQDAARQSQTLIPPLAPRLKGTGEKTRLFGTTHWAIVFQQVNDVFSLISCNLINLLE